MFKGKEPFLSFEKVGLACKCLVELWGGNLRSGYKLAVGMWNVTSLAGKESELVCEVERYQVDKLGSSLDTALALGQNTWRRAGLCGDPLKPPAEGLPVAV